MKKIVIFTIILISIFNISLAETTQVGIPTPSHPNVHQTNITIRSEWQQTELGAKSEKITVGETEALKASLRSVLQQELAFLKENGNHELNTAQTKQLNETLSSIEQTLSTAGVPVPTPSAHH